MPPCDFTGICSEWFVRDPVGTEEAKNPDRLNDSRYSTQGYILGLLYSVHISTTQLVVFESSTCSSNCQALTALDRQRKIGVTKDRYLSIAMRSIDLDSRFLFRLPMLAEEKHVGAPRAASRVPMIEVSVNGGSKIWR